MRSGRRPGQLTMDWCIHRRMAWQVLDGKALLVELDTNVAAGLNETGTLVWRLLEQGVGRDGLVAEVAREYGIASADAERDVGAFLGLLEAKGWIEARTA